VETEKLIDADAPPDEAVRVSSQRDGRSGRCARRHGRGAAVRGLAAVGHAARAHHATYRRRDLPYEDNVLAILQENLARLWRGETELLNQVV
jgi:hypothetical protein